MLRARALPAIAMAVTLAGCASFGHWFGGAPEPTATPAAQGGEVFYSAVAGLTVYAEPSSAAAVVGHLALHERVTRSRIERGYANVTAPGSGLSGWVDNAQLVWRLPTARATATAAPPPPPAEASAAPAATPTPAAAPSVAAPAEPSAAMPSTPVSAPTPAKKSGAEPAILDPF
ncbi:hypothetical protein KF840_19720 [bacterium]|nr:hypothetical protein [bacterium]